MNFSQGHSVTKVQFVNRACFPKKKPQNSQKWAKFMNFSFCPLSLVWFAGATPEKLRKKISGNCSRNNVVSECNVVLLQMHLHNATQLLASPPDLEVAKRTK